jgi:hypothetical protein
VTSRTVKAARFFSSRRRDQKGQSSPEDIASGVDVGVGFVPASLTSKRRLTDTITSLAVSTFVTVLTGEPGVHAQYQAPSFFRFGF